MNWTEILSIVLNLAFGGGLLVSIATIRSQKRKGNAEADKALAEVKTTELDNVQEAVKIWREMAEGLKMELDNYRQNYADMSRQIEELKKEINRLANTNNRIVRLLDKITPENLEELKAEILKLHNNEGN